MNASQRVLKAIGIFGGVRSVDIICAVVRAKLIASLIGPFGVGLFAIYNTALDLISNTTQLSIRQSAVRDMSDAPRSRHPRLASAVRWWSARLGLFGAAVMLLASPLLSLISFGDTSHWWAFAVLSVAVLALAVSNGEQAIMQGVGQLKALAATGVGISLALIAVAIPLLFWLRIDSVLPIVAISPLVAMAIAKGMSRQHSERGSSKENIAIGRGFLKLGAYLTVSATAAAVASYVFVNYLNDVADTQEVGIYQAGYTLVVRYVSLIFAALAAEYYPRLVKVSCRKRYASAVISHQISVLMCVLSFVVVLFIALDHVALTLLYSGEFLGALPMIDVGILGALFQGVSYCMAYLILARGDGKAYIATDLTSAAVGLCLNIVMYRCWGLAGLGCSFVLWYALYAALVWIVCYRRYGLRISHGACWIMLGSIAICVVAFALKQIGWWAPLLMLLGCGVLAWRAQRSRH